MKGFTMCEFTRQELQTVETALSTYMADMYERANKFNAMANAVPMGTTSNLTYLKHAETYMNNYDCASDLRDKVMATTLDTPLVLSTTGKRVSIELQTSTPKYDGPTLT